MHAWSYAKWEIGIANGAANCSLLFSGSIAFESTQSIVVGMVLSVLLRDRVAARSNSNAASTQRNPADFAEFVASCQARKVGPIFRSVGKTVPLGHGVTLGYWRAAAARFFPRQSVPPEWRCSVFSHRIRNRGKRALRN